MWKSSGIFCYLKSQYLEPKNHHSRKPTDAISKNNFGGQKIINVGFLWKNRVFSMDKFYIGNIEMC